METTMTDHRIHDITHDSHGEPLVTPLNLEVRTFQNATVLVVHGADGSEVASVHLEVDARRGGKVVLRAWDARTGSDDGVPCVEEELQLEDDRA
jgi:hypothetical protein